MSTPETDIQFGEYAYGVRQGDILSRGFNITGTHPFTEGDLSIKISDKNPDRVDVVAEILDFSGEASFPGVKVLEGVYLSVAQSDLLGTDPIFNKIAWSKVISGITKERAVRALESGQI